MPLAQRTKTLTNGVDGRTWVVSREFESHDHHENAFAKKMNFLIVKNLKKYSWIPKNWNRVLVARRPVYLVRFRGGCCEA